MRPDRGIQLTLKFRVDRSRKVQGCAGWDRFRPDRRARARARRRGRRALARVGAGGLAGHAERPVGGLKGHQLAQRAGRRMGPGGEHAQLRLARLPRELGGRRRAPGGEVARLAPARVGQLGGGRRGVGRRRSAASSGDSWTPATSHASIVAASQSTPSCQKCPSSSVSSAQTATRRPRAGAPPPRRSRARARGPGRPRVPGRTGPVDRPRRVAVLGVVARVAVGRRGGVAAVVHTRSISARSIGTRSGPEALRSGCSWRQAVAEHVGEIEADSVHAGLLQQRVEPRRVPALRQPEAAVPVPEALAVRGDAGADLEPHAGGGGEHRQHGVGGRRRPAPCGANAPTRSRPRASKRSAARVYRAAERSSSRATPGSSAAAMSRRCVSGRTSRRKARKRSGTPPASSWSHSTGVSESVIRPGWASSTSASGR